jgi:hypothetical protein
LLPQFIENSGLKTNKYPSVIQMVVNGGTGSMQSLIVDGKCLMGDAPTRADDGGGDAINFMFHRTAKSLMEDGFSAALQATGLHKELQLVAAAKTLCEDETNPSSFTGSVIGQSNLGSVIVERVSSTPGTLAEDSMADGVSCEWEMVPEDIDR